MILNLFRKSRALVAGAFVLGGCVSSAPPKRPLDLPFQKVIPSTYETVWAATTQVLDIYSVVRIDRDAGLIETDWSDFRFNRALYENPDAPDYLESVRYRLKLRLSKGIVAQTGSPAVRVQVTKELAEHKNFLTDWQRIPTDQVEEKVILYRIGQRVRVAESLKRKSQGSKEAGGAKSADDSAADADFSNAKNQK